MHMGSNTLWIIVGKSLFSVLSTDRAVPKGQIHHGGGPHGHIPSPENCCNFLLTGLSQMQK